MNRLVKKLASIRYLLLFAFVLRLLFVYFQYSGDIGNHLAWGRGALEGTLGFFHKSFPGFNQPNYPPITILLFSLSAWFYQFMQTLVISINQAVLLFPSKIVPLMETLNMQAAFIKLPAILADLGIGWLIYKLAPVKKKSSRLIASSLYLLNPAVIYISTVWGQIESIPIFFTLLSLYILKKNYYLSHVFFTLAILSKQTALWLLPIFLILWLKKHSLKSFLQGASLQVVVFILIYLPFTFSLLEPFKLYLQTLSGSSTLVSDAAWNLWHYLYPVSTLDSVLFLGLSVRLWSILLLLFSISFIAIKFFKNRITLFQSLFWLSLVAFFLQTRVHERHLFPALVFYILAFKPSSTKLVGFITLTLYHLFNLYWSLGLPFI
jgi:dolichyl-phosphate-mannose-protein mannosyltransferase